MFDPTVFDNLKVIVEGTVYDAEVDKQIKILDREDHVNIANMSRMFRISFQLHDSEALITEDKTKPVAAVKLHSGLNDFYMESKIEAEKATEKNNNILSFPKPTTENGYGCTFTVSFSIEKKLSSSDLQKQYILQYEPLLETISTSWDEKTSYDATFSYDALERCWKSGYTFTVHVPHKIGENQMDLLYDAFVRTQETLQMLEEHMENEAAN
ncbi:hypothetical protein [Longirhabdus pacifica]|uniref:hypothetical protein n=1 Tax=Longirhabdus pacifica TaxID=2305227 RepID=UPI0010087A4E|nr:hypothetical protein [Longirhabdus pacifica]